MGNKNLFIYWKGKQFQFSCCDFRFVRIVDAFPACNFTCSFVVVEFVPVFTLNHIDIRPIRPSRTSTSFHSDVRQMLGGCQVSVNYGKQGSHASGQHPCMGPLKQVVCQVEPSFLTSLQPRSIQREKPSSVPST